MRVDPSAIAGEGVFAERAIEPGELIRAVNVVREITAEAPLRPEDGERLEHCSYPDGKVVLYGAPDRHYNHSCDPNAWTRFAGDRAEIVARRRIEAGDEITLDYLINSHGGDSWECNCGARRCRGMTMNSFFALPLDVQREYLPLLAEWFVNRHEERVAQLRELLDVPESTGPAGS